MKKIPCFRVPYAGIICLAILIVKGLLIGKGESLL